nr:DNA helicase [Tanacetum cinerariifolium]
MWTNIFQPDPTQDPDGYRELMMHGPCGYANKNASCMKDGNKCNRNFPKPYCDATYIDKDGFVHYHRRDTNINTERQEVCLDNTYVVPFNRALCMRGDRDGNHLGTRTILSISFTGGPRYMYAHYLDVLAICRVHGNPSFFITFTCNVKWPEIQEYMDSWPQLTTADRADIVDRVFEQKLRNADIHIYNVIGTRRYDLPTPETTRAVVFGGKTATESEFDLIIEEHSQIP